MGRLDLWSDVFLGAFLVGLLATVGMFLLGWHSGADGVDAGHLGHGHGGGHGHGHGHADAGDGGLGKMLLPALNVSSMLAFLMGGGAAGYITLRLHGSLGIALGAAAGAGFVGAWVITQALRLLKRAEAGVVTAADLVGTSARVIAPVGGKRVGEIVFTREGVRQALPARADDGAAGEIARDEEVVVLRVERGTAYVRKASALFALEKSK